MPSAQLSLINREVEHTLIQQRAVDGYINATAMCQAAGKQLTNYLRQRTTMAFLEELSSVTLIGATGLVQVIQDGPPELQGIWVHPQVAVHLAQWLSPAFAVKVTDWVFEWRSGKASRLPDHLRRYIVNQPKIPHDHFSMLDQMTLRILAPLERHGYILPKELMLDISLGKIFSNWLKKRGYNLDAFPVYQHEFLDHRPTVEAPPVSQSVVERLQPRTGKLVAGR